MGIHLTPLDAAFLELEEADDSAHMHIGWAMVFDPPPGGERPSLQELRRRTRERLGPLPRFRRRLSKPRVGTLSLPEWVADEEIDVADQMRRATLPAPGGEAELMEWLGDFFSHRLDRSRPLWETTLLEGLEGGRWALVTKAHHCLIDGLSGAAIVTVLLDAEPEPGEGSATIADLLGAGDGGGGGRGGGRHRVLGRLRDAVGGTIDAATHPRRLISESRSVVETLVRDEIVSAPRTSLNGPIGGSRRLAAVDAPLADLKRIKRELGGSVNDVVLAATAGGLNRLFRAARRGGGRQGAGDGPGQRARGERVAGARQPRLLAVRRPGRSPSPTRCCATARSPPRPRS